MKPEQISKTYVTVPEIMAECGVDKSTAFNWLRHFGYMNHEKILGRRVVLRTEFERFKREHSELVKAKQVA